MNEREFRDSKAGATDTENPSSRRHVHAVNDRPFAAALPGNALSAILYGTLNLTYRGLRFCKNPFDTLLYLRLIETLRPAAIIEIGTSEGGSALWFRDQCRTLGLETHIHTIDLNLPACKHDGIAYHTGDAESPNTSFPIKELSDLPHPWLISEDSAHTYEACSEVLRFFSPRMIAGDYIIVEDGIVADLPEERFAKYQDGPNRAVAEFLSSNPQTFNIAHEYCDLFGHNVTFAPNGWIRRV